MARQTYPKLAFDRATARDIATVTNSLRDGKVNSVGEFTIPDTHDEALPFTVFDPYVTPESFIACMPMDIGGANAVPFVTNLVNATSFDVILQWNPLNDRYALGGMGGASGTITTGVVDYTVASVSSNMTVDLALNRLVIERPGLYSGQVSFYCSAANNGDVTFEVRGNGISMASWTFTFSQQTGVQGLSIPYTNNLADADYVDVNVTAATGSPTYVQSSLFLDMIAPEFVDIDRTYRYLVLG